MPLARDNNGVATTRLSYRFTYGQRSIHVHYRRGGAAGEYILQYRLRILSPRIIGGNNNLVCVRCGYSPHLGTLAPISIPPTPKHAPQVADSRHPNRSQYSLQSVRGMRVINEYARAPLSYPLKTTRHMRRDPYRGGDIILSVSETDKRGERRDDVLRVVRSDKWRRDCACRNCRG